MRDHLDLCWGFDRQSMNKDIKMHNDCQIFCDQTSGANKLTTLIICGKINNLPQIGRTRRHLTL